jgi:hypothetical protein
MDASRRRTQIQKLIGSGGLPTSLSRSETVDPAGSPIGRCIVCGDQGHHRILWQSQIIKKPLLCVNCFAIWLKTVQHPMS